MAAVNTKSNSITHDDAVPLVRNSRYLVAAPLLFDNATVEVAAADDDGSVYRFFRIPSNALIHSLALYNDAITDGLDEEDAVISTDYDLGLYKQASDGGAVADINIFADAVDLSVARKAALDGLFYTNDIANIEKRVWEILGLATDPHLLYDVALTSATNGQDAGTVTLKINYTV